MTKNHVQALQNKVTPINIKSIAQHGNDIF